MLKKAGIALLVLIAGIALVIGLSLAMPATVAVAVWNRPAGIEQEPQPALEPDDPSWDEYSVWRPGRELPKRSEETE